MLQGARYQGNEHVYQAWLELLLLQVILKDQGERVKMTVKKAMANGITYQFCLDIPR